MSEVDDALRLIDAKDQDRERWLWFFLRALSVVAAFLIVVALAGSSTYSCYVSTNRGETCPDCNGVGWKMCDKCHAVDERYRRGTVQCEHCRGTGKIQTGKIQTPAEKKS